MVIAYINGMKTKTTKNTKVTRKEILEQINDPEALGYIIENQSNWTDRKVDTELIFKLADEGLIRYNHKDDIWIAT